MRVLASLLYRLGIRFYRVEHDCRVPWLCRFGHLLAPRGTEAVCERCGMLVALPFADVAKKG